MVKARNHVSGAVFKVAALVLSCVVLLGVALLGVSPSTAFVDDTKAGALPAVAQALSVDIPASPEIPVSSEIASSSAQEATAQKEAHAAQPPKADLPAKESEPLSSTELERLIADITEAQNQVMMQGSTVADVDRLFAFYTPDFSYVHEAYGGHYSRDELYGNTVRLLKQGRYNLTAPRYVVTATIAGFNSIAVARQETHNGVTATHLALFEFRGDKVSRITEYWK